RRPAASGPTGGGFDERLTRGGVYALHRQPSVTGRDSRVPRRLRDASPALNSFEQFEPSVTEDRLAAALNAEAQPCAPPLAPGRPVFPHIESPYTRVPGLM